jgi:hypothetical protein
MTGIVEIAERVKGGPYHNWLYLSGRDLFSVIAIERTVAETYFNMEVSLIVKDLIGRYAPELTTSNVQATSVVVDELIFNYKPLNEVLDYLAVISDSEYYCDSGLDLHWFAEETQSNNVTYSETGSSDYISPSPHIRDNLIPVKNHVIVFGAESLSIDRSSTGVSASVTDMNSYYYAVKFTPGKRRLRRLDLYIAKVGSPGDLSGKIVEESGGNPTGPVMDYFAFRSGQVSSAGWYSVFPRAILDTSKSYWIILVKTGDASNRYEWHHDNGSTGANAYSGDGSSWTVQTNSYTFAYKIYHGTPIIAEAVDTVGLASYKRRTTVIRDETIRSLEAARRLASAKLAELTGPRVEIEDLTIYNPSTIPQTGKTVTVDIPSYGINTSYTVKEVQLLWVDGEMGLDSYKVYLAQSPSKDDLPKVIADLKKSLQEERLADQSVDTLDLLKIFYETLSISDTLYADQNKKTILESLSLSDALSKTEQSAGNFIIDVSKIGFCDIAPG